MRKVSPLAWLDFQLPKNQQSEENDCEWHEVKSNPQEIGVCCRTAFDSRSNTVRNHERDEHQKRMQRSAQSAEQDDQHAEERLQIEQAQENARQNSVGFVSHFSCREIVYHFDESDDRREQNEIANERMQEQYDIHFLLPCYHYSPLGGNQKKESAIKSKCFSRWRKAFALSNLISALGLPCGLDTQKAS